MKNRIYIRYALLCVMLLGFQLGMNAQKPVTKELKALIQSEFENTSNAGAERLSSEEIIQMETKKYFDLKRKIATGDFGEEDFAKKKGAKYPSNEKNEASKFDVPDLTFNPEVAQVNPNSQGLINRLQVNNNEFNGLVNFGLNLTTLQSYDLTVPVILNYAKSGIRVDEMGSEVGHGFDITTGAKLTRVVNGLPDEFQGKINKYTALPYEDIWKYTEGEYEYAGIDGYGFLHLDETDYDDPENFDSWSETKQKKAVKYNDWTSIPFYKIDYDDWGEEEPIALDFTPDEFYYQAGSYTGKFQFQKEHPYLIKSDKDVKITFSNTSSTQRYLEFEITTPDGVTYLFGADAGFVETNQNTTFTLRNSYSYKYVNEEFDFLNVTPVLPAYVNFSCETDCDCSTDATKYEPLDYRITPYVVLQHPKYVSDFLARTITSPSGDVISYAYEDQEVVSYTADKSYAYASPAIEELSTNIELQGSQVTFPLLVAENGSSRFTETKLDDVSDPLPEYCVSTNEYYNRLSSFSFSYTANRAIRRRLSTITGSNGRALAFSYNKNRLDVVNDKLLTRVGKLINGQEIQAWKLDYDDDINGSELAHYVNKQNIYRLNYYRGYNLKSATNDSIITDGVSPNGIPVAGYSELNMSELTSLSIILSRFGGQIPFDNIPPQDVQELFMAQELLDDLESNFVAEFDRSYLSSITQVGKEGGEIVLQDFSYDPNELVKRFSAQQDIWGFQTNNPSGYHFPVIEGGEISFDPTYTFPGTGSFGTVCPSNDVLLSSVKMPTFAFANNSIGPNGELGASNFCNPLIEAHIAQTIGAFDYSDEPSFNQHRLLMSSVSHTGLTKTVVYENNTYTNDNTADGAGNRVLSLTTINPGSPSLHEDFTYEETTPGINTIKPVKHLNGRLLFELPNWGWLYRFDKYEPIRLLSSKGYNRMPNRQQGITGYGKVTKQLSTPDSDCEDNPSFNCGYGKVVTHFDTGVAYQEPQTFRIWNNSPPGLVDNFYHVTGAELSSDPAASGTEGTSTHIKMYNEAGDLIKEKINTFQAAEGVDYFKLFTAWTPDYNNDGGPVLDAEYYFTRNEYKLRDSPLLMQSTDRTYADDGSGTFVEVITNNTYNDENNITNTSMVNSDGLIHSINRKYATDFISNSTYGPLVDRNMIGIPLLTELSNGYATWLEYDTFGDNMKPVGVWDNKEGTWLARVVIESYDDYLLPAVIQRHGYEPDTYTYTADGLLESQTYLDRVTSYTYDPVTRIMASSTDEALQTTEYTQDEFLRTDFVSSRGGVITSDISYSFGAGGNSTTAINNIFGVSFTPNEITNFDAAGNVLSTVNTGYAVNGGDFTKSQSRDALGNVIKSCDPGAGGCTTATFEASPLGRIQSRTAPGWPAAVTTKHLVNAGADVPGYAVGTLFKTVVIDEDQNETHTFTDKVGQVVLVRNFTEGATGAIDTRNTFNIRGELVTTTQAEGDVFTYTYNPDGTLLTKHVPGTVGDYEYTYNVRDLVETITDPNGNVLTYTYDDYDQELTVSNDDGLIIANTYFGVEEGKTGKLASRKVKIMTTGQWVSETFTYDEYGRSTKSIVDSEMHAASITKLNQFDNRDLVKVEYTALQGSPWNEAYSLKTIINQYDHGGRLENTKFSREAGGTTPVANYVYNDNDWLIQKNLGGYSATDALQVVDYEYNSRGLLTKINGIADVRKSFAWGDCEEQGCADGGGVSIDHATLLELLVNQGTDGNGALNFECHDPCYSEIVDGPVDGLVNQTGDFILGQDIPRAEVSILGCDDLALISTESKSTRDCDETVAVREDARAVELNNYLSAFEFSAIANSLPNTDKNALDNTRQSNGLSWSNEGQSGGVVWDVAALLDLEAEDAVVEQFEVQIKVENKSLEEFHLALESNNELLPLLESGQLVIDAKSAIHSTDGKFATVQIAPEAKLTLDQIRNLKLLSHVRGGDVVIENVSTRVSYTQRCKPDCDEAVRCDEAAYTEQQIAVPTIQNALDVLSPSKVTFPLVLARVKLCDQSTIYVTGSSLPQLGAASSYLVMDEVVVNSFGQMLSIETASGTEQAPFDNLLLGAVNKINLSTVINVNDYKCDTDPPTDPPTTPPGDCPPLECSDEQAYTQLQAYNYIQDIVAGMTTEDIVNPELNLILLCNGMQVYVFTQHLLLLPQPYINLQTINIDLLQTDIIVSGPATNYLNDLFAMNIAYNENSIDALESTPKLNGNISYLEWQAAGGPVQGYGFTYDGLNRLTRAKHNDKDLNGFYTNSDRYTVESIGYTPNGNISSLNRHGVTGNCENDYQLGLIDRLVYTYDPTNHNQLIEVREGVVDEDFRFRGFNPGNDDNGYTYDDNGNMITDSYKGLMVVIDNHLNLPKRYVMNKNGETISIQLHYDYLGRLWQKEIIGTEDEPIVIDYIDGIEYHNKKWNSIAHAEGRMVRKVADDPTEHYSQYVLQDHLGNSRVVFGDLNDDGYIQLTYNATTGDPAEVLQINHYYPFGMNFDGDFTSPALDAEQLKYQYNGKEYNDYGVATGTDPDFKDVALKLSDYGARWYDAAIGRWTAVDPLAADFASWSSYIYTFDNPISFIDPDGRAPKPPDDFIVNEHGEVVEIIATNDPHRILTESGEVLYSNDPSTDQQEMDLYDVGFQMVQFINDDMIEDIMAVRGAGSGEGNLVSNSYGKFDFVWSELKVNYTNDLMKESERRRGVGLGRGGYIEHGGFYVFGDKSEYGDRRKVYNMHDAGNFLWGNANRREGHSAKKLLWGANLNELINFRWGDSNADMQAILDGYYH